MKHVFLSMAFVLAGKIAFGQSYFPPKNSPVWDTTNPATLGWCQAEIDSLDSFLSATNTKGFLILKDGKIVHEKYFGTFTQDSLWYWASAGKSLFGFLAGQAIEQGFFNVTDTVSTYLGTGWTSCTPAQEEKITVQNMLSMTSGLLDNQTNLDCTLPTCLTCLTTPNTRWAYHSAVYTLAHTVLETATATSLNMFTYQNVLQPTGMGGLWFKSGYNEIFGSKLRDMARFGLLVQNNGVWNGDTLLADTSYFNQMINSSQNMNKAYGYLWWLNGKSSHMLPQSQLVFNGWLIPNAPADAWCALGKNDQKIYASQSTGLVVVRMGNSAGQPHLAVSSFDNQLWEKINALTCGNIRVVEHAEQPILNAFSVPGSFTITIETGKNGSFQLFSLNGQLLQKGNLEANQPKIISAKSGVYLIKLQTETGVTTQRVAVY